MYLPGFSVLLRLLLLHSLAPHSTSGKQLDRRQDISRLGNLSPYHDAPDVPGVSADLPQDCTVDQVILLHRHGSPNRLPPTWEAFVLQLVATLQKSKDVIQTDDLPPYLEFLKKGYTYDQAPDQLTVVGAKEVFDHGVEFALRYPNLTTDQVVSTTAQRVIDSAHFFVQGFTGRWADNMMYLTTKNFTDPVPWLSPWDVCPKFTFDAAFAANQEWARKYVPPIMDRLNDLVPGVGFTLNDTQGALYACPYDLAARDRSSWCNLFTADELEGLEYQQDVTLDIYTGRLSRGDAGPLVGAFYVKKLIERLTDPNAKPLYLDFAHDITVLVALSTLGLNKDPEPLSPNVDRPPTDRRFRTSDQAPFAAEMIWERFTCESSFQGPQVRLVLDQATFPLSICNQTEDDLKYGTCSLDAFMKANAYSTGVEYNSAVWNATCGH